MNKKVLLLIWGVCISILFPQQGLPTSYRSLRVEGKKQAYEQTINWPKWYDRLLDGNVCAEHLLMNRNWVNTLGEQRHNNELADDDSVHEDSDGESKIVKKPHPMYLLDECPCKHSCRLSTELRTTAARKLVSLVKKRYPNKRERIVYTSLGAAKLFQDLVNICMLLNEGYTNLVVNLVDDSFTFLIDILRKRNEDTLDWLDDSAIDNIFYPFRKTKVCGWVNSLFFTASQIQRRQEFFKTILTSRDLRTRLGKRYGVYLFEDYKYNMSYEEFLIRFNDLDAFVVDRIKPIVNKRVSGDKPADYGYGTIADVNNRLVQFIRFLENNPYRSDIRVDLYGGIMGYDYFQDCREHPQLSKSDILVCFDVDDALSWLTFVAAADTTTWSKSVAVGFEVGQQPVWFDKRDWNGDVFSDQFCRRLIGEWFDARAVN